MSGTPLATSFDTNPDSQPIQPTSDTDIDMTSSANAAAGGESSLSTLAGGAAGSSNTNGGPSVSIADNVGSSSGNHNFNGTGAGGIPTGGEGLDAAIAEFEARVPRREKNLREFLAMMDEYAPIIPDAVTDYYLSLAGFQTSDVRIKRLLALATQKFIADIAADAYQYARIRTSSSNASAFTAGGGALPGGGLGGGSLGGLGGAGGGYATSGRRGGRMILTMDDLGGAVAEYGVNTKRPEFYR